MKAATSLLLFSVVGLLVFGIVTLVSASMSQPEARFLVMQPIWAGLGLLACLAGAAINYRWLRSAWWVLLLLAIVLLVCVWIPGLGVRRNGASRWIGVGSFGIQPSELAKVALIVALAWYGERYQRFMSQFLRGAVIPGAGAAVVLGLIFKEPDVGTTALLGALTCLLLLIAGARWFHVGLPVALACAALATFIANNPMRSDRIYAWLHPYETRLDTGLQAWQSMAALGSGGVRGVGLGEGRQKLGFVPENHTDFILSVIGEELGLAATLSVIAAYLTILTCGVYIAWHAADTFGMLLASGITFLIGLQATINIGVVTGAFPNKGIALPFLSYGGSNLVVMLGCVGLLLSVGRLAAVPARVRELNPDAAAEPGLA
ncbi:MAG: Lipid flippase FtsW [Verrucomicrobiota bacterium]